ncbi:MAG: undecaprenyl-diphosphate phosphatase [Pseudomonadales bacterium]|nr:undecaprenyl-diphosphate phosphatase [Pseudomonadales bacterium]
MEFIQTVVLALIQGLSEFLPISSSAHLILPAQVFGWPDQGLLFDVAVHVGSLCAVIFYFRVELHGLACAWLGSLSPRGNNLLQLPLARQPEQAQVAWMLVLATLPILLAGFLGKDFVAAHLRSTLVIAITTLLFAGFLALAELRSRKQREVMPLCFRFALLIGLAQVLALVPGTSRSGVTITAAVLLGMSKKDGAQFSFLLSIPVIFAAGCLLAADLFSQRVEFEWLKLATAVVVSGLSAWCCIALFLRVIERIGLMPFVWYRVALGLVLLALVGGNAS